MSQFRGAVAGGCIGVADAYGLGISVGDGAGGIKGSAIMSDGGASVGRGGLLRRIVSGSLKLSESSGKTFHTFPILFRFVF